MTRLLPPPAWGAAIVRHFRMWFAHLMGPFSMEKPVTVMSDEHPMYLFSQHQADFSSFHISPVAVPSKQSKSSHLSPTCEQHQFALISGHDDFCPR
jgi:hypothetical protein